MHLLYLPRGKKEALSLQCGTFLFVGPFSGKSACQRRALPEHRIAKRTSHIHSPGKLLCRASAPQKATHAPALFASGQKRSALAAVWGVVFLLDASRGDLLVNAEFPQNTALPNELPTSTHQANFGARHLLRKGQPMHLPQLPRVKKEALSLQCGTFFFCWALLGEIFLSTQSPPRRTHCQTNLPHLLTRQTSVRASAPQGATHVSALVASGKKRSALAAAWGVFFLLGASRGDFLVNAEPSQNNALPNEPPTSLNKVFGDDRPKLPRARNNTLWVTFGASARFPCPHRRNRRSGSRRK